MTTEKQARITVDLSDRVALVTGAGRGLGKAIAGALAESGAAVACVDVDQESLDAAVELIVAAGGNARAYVCNVTDSEAVKATVKAVCADLGGLDILVNNAGITRDNLILRMKDDQWTSVIDINLSGTFYFTRAAARPIIKSAAGRIINIASISGQMGNPGQANYSASKAGVIGLTRTVARELAGRGVTVNAIAPGFIETDMTAKLGEEMVDRIKEQLPLGRLGDVRDIADAVLYLAGPSGGFITGQVITIDGGMTA